MHKPPSVIFLMGPTASGKTAIAVELAQRLPVDIISVDSALVYRGMDIGTAKPDASVLAKAPHRLIDIRDPSERYSAAEFRADALREIAAAHARGRVPLLVGGTMLYFRALQYGLAELPEGNPEVRARIEGEAAALGWSVMHERLRDLDPDSAARIHANDPQRIQRALEVYELTGRPMSELLARGAAGALPYRLAKWIVAPRDRRRLHRNIEIRFRDMLDKGLINEVAALRCRGDLSLQVPAMRAVGYRQVWEYLDERYGFEEMVQKGIAATRQFAKRQLTWLRAENNADWFYSEDDQLVALLALRGEALLPVGGS